MTRIKIVLFIIGLIILGSALPNVADAAQAPSFTLKTVDGKKVSLSDYKGKIVILNFWATWCPPCRTEIPHFIKVQKDYAEKGVQVIGLSLDDQSSDVKSFIKEAKFNYPIVMADQKVQVAYGTISAIPTTFILDQKHTLVDKAVGFRDEEYLVSKIEGLLGKK